MGADNRSESLEELDRNSQTVPLISEHEETAEKLDMSQDLTCGALGNNMKKAKSLIFAATSPIPFHYVTQRNVKLLAFATIMLFIVYRGIVRTKLNNNSCNWLLEQGRIQGRALWQPDGCMVHNYSSIDSRNCLRHKRVSNRSFVFIGDSRIRYLFNETVLHITDSRPVYPDGKHNNLTVNDPGLHFYLQFYWSPLVNEEMRRLIEEISKSSTDALPEMILISAATWHMKLSNSSKAAFENYKSNLTALVPLLNDLASRTTVIWVSQGPVFERLLSSGRAMITNNEIWKYNWAAEEVIRQTKVQFWKSNQLVYWSFGDSEDGLHMGNSTIYQTLQILLNYHCNREMRHHDATCCVQPSPLLLSQILTLCFLGLFLIITIVVSVRQYGTQVLRNIQLKWKRQALYTNGNLMPDKSLIIKDAKIIKKVKTREEVLRAVVFALGKLGIIMGYFILCDRTDFFMKENKYYSNLNFFVPLLYIFLIALFFSAKSDQSSLLNRDQTDDWKGWMQFVILVYHMTAGSTQLPIYMHIRVLVSAYLFLNGYAHFMYFWSKGDVSAYRFFQIVFRMNLLVICLCLVMHQQYQFYYFVPLVTFWFILTYLTMALPPRVTQTSAGLYPRHHLYIVLKFVALFGLITTLYLSQTFFEQIFLTKPWASLFLLNGNVHEWFFRWKLDRYSVLGGMVFGYLITLSRKYGWLNENQSENLFNSTKKSLAAVGVGVAALVSYLIFALTCRNKKSCNEIHSYIVFLPILGFILVRNTFGPIRRRYSVIFAWAGKISLELFIVQFHIWLAADTYGVLVMIPGYPMLNVMLTSFIFIAVAHEIHVITGVLAEHFVPQDWKYLTLAVTIFGIFLGLLAVAY